jgi:polysaccharide biosynthesis/export protein
MLNNSARLLKRSHKADAKPGNFLKALSWTLPAVLLALASGCETQKAIDQRSKATGTGEKQASVKSETQAVAEAKHMSTASPANNETLVLHEGDTLSVSFAGAPDLNTVAVIRRDGRITLKSLGEFKAAGLTPLEMEKELIKLYGPQLQTKEVTVAVQSSAFPVYVTGAVLRPGKILSDRPMTALEAIMEAGGFDYGKANLKSIRVLRTQDGRTEHYTLNLKKVLNGQEPEQFALKPSDIIYVPEKFNWF